MAGIASVRSNIACPLPWLQAVREAGLATGVSTLVMVTVGSGLGIKLQASDSLIISVMVKVVVSVTVNTSSERLVSPL